MEITIFSKKRQTKEGKTFYIYLSTLTKNDGTTLPVSVRFKESCGSPDAHSCPMRISFDKKDANLSTRQYIHSETGEPAEAHTLWVSKWAESGEYVDHSLDDFE